MAELNDDVTKMADILNLNENLLRIKKIIKAAYSVTMNIFRKIFFSF